LSSTKTGKYTMKVPVESLVAAPIDRGWQAYTTPADIICWNAAPSVHAMQRQATDVVRPFSAITPQEHPNA
jgi:uncharacterized protein YndB with AHSA1/START domain